MKPFVKQSLQFVLFFLIGAFILYFLYQSQSSKYLEDCLQKGISPGECHLLEKIWKDVQSANYFWIGLIVALFMVSNILRAIRWVQILGAAGAAIRFQNAFMATMIGYFANLGLPRIGEFAKAGMLAKYEDIKIEKVFATVVTDRVADVLMLALLLGLALLLEFDVLWAYLERNQAITSRMSSFFQSGIFLGLLILAVLGALVCLFNLKRIRTTFIYSRITEVSNNFWQALKSIRQLQNPFLFVVLTVGIWLLYFLMTYLCFFAFEPTSSLTALAGLTTFVFGSLGIVFPSPGGMGSYHFLIVQALGFYGVSSIDAFSFANILFFSVQIFSNILFGISSLILMPILNNRKS